MSFSLINTWAVGDKLTSAQANAIAIDLTKALDKSVAGDTISGVVDVSGTGQLSIQVASGVLATTPDAIVPSIFRGISDGGVAGGIAASTLGGISDGGVAGGITATTPGGISDGGVAGGIAPTVAKGISDGGVVGGIAPGIAGGITDGGVVHGIRATVGAGIYAAVAGGISTNVAGGIAPQSGGSITDGGIAGGIHITAIAGQQIDNGASLQVNNGGLIGILSGGSMVGAVGSSILALGSLVSTGGLAGASGLPLVLGVSLFVINSTGTTIFGAGTQANPIIQVQVTAGPGNPLTGDVTLDLGPSPTGSIYFLDFTRISSLAGHSVFIKNGAFTSSALTPAQAVIAFCTASNRVACVSL